MSTNWTSPSILDQYAEDESHIAWNSTDVSLILSGTSISTASPLLHIAREPRNDIKMKTYFLRATGFNFQNLPDTISGIECKVSLKRGGRITDETVQLCLNETLIGENRANLEVHPEKVYGSHTDTWNASDLTTAMLQDPTFGIVLRFQSHPKWPHKTTPTFSSVEIQIY
jgi:hypothetical protein